MSKPKHTPGPWVRNGYGIVRPGYSHDPIAIVKLTGFCVETEANADLITAAPELKLAGTEALILLCRLMEERILADPAYRRDQYDADALIVGELSDALKKAAKSEGRGE